MDFGNLSTDWESELCDNNSNEVKRKMRQKLHTAAGTTTMGLAQARPNNN